MEMLENKDKLNDFLIFRFKCSMQALETFLLAKEKKEAIEILIRTLMLSYRVDGENITDIMKPEEKKKLQEKINNSDFNLTGWNDKVLKYALKRFLNLGNLMILIAAY